MNGRYTARSGGRSSVLTKDGIFTAEETFDRHNLALMGRYWDGAQRGVHDNKWSGLDTLTRKAGGSITVTARDGQVYTLATDHDLLRRMWRTIDAEDTFIFEPDEERKWTARLFDDRGDAMGTMYLREGDQLIHWHVAGSEAAFVFGGAAGLSDTLLEAFRAEIEQELRDRAHGRRRMDGDFTEPLERAMKRKRHLPYLGCDDPLDADDEFYVFGSCPACGLEAHMTRSGALKGQAIERKCTRENKEAVRAYHRSSRYWKKVRESLEKETRGET